MKRTTILDLSRFKFLTTVRENASIIAFCALFVFSLLSGCLFSVFSRFNVLSEGICSFYLSNQVSSNFYSVFIFSFLVSFAFLFITFIFGTSVIGIAFIPAIVVVRGFVTGLFLGEIYCKYGFNAIAYNLLIFIPANTVSVLTLIVASSSAIKMSYGLGRLLLSKERNIGVDFSKKTAILFITLIFITAFSALLNALLSSAFLKYLSLG